MKKMWVDVSIKVITTETAKVRIELEGGSLEKPGELLELAKQAAKDKLLEIVSDPKDLVLYDVGSEINLLRFYQELAGKPDTKCPIEISVLKELASGGSRIN